MNKRMFIKNKKRIKLHKRRVCRSYDDTQNEGIANMQYDQ